MALDPISILMSIATNLATDIVKHYAQRLDGTLVGRGLKQIGLIEKNRDDYLHEILKETLSLYFQTHSTYDISGVESFFHDNATIEQIGNYIFDHRPLDQLAIDKALTRNIKSDAITMALMHKRGGQPEQIIPDFLQCYRRVLNQHADAAERAILLTVLDATDTVVAEIRASEERMKAFVTEALRINRGGTSALVSGQVIGQYRIQRHLTTGTFGTLYLADQQNTGSTVVLKVVSVPNELRLHHDVFSLGMYLIDLKHPSILPTLEVNLDGVFPYVVTTYITGGSLYERLKPSTVLSLPDKFTILSQVGNALAYLHSQDIIHRGIQPASILFDDAGNALLTGFDLAIRASAAKHRLQSNQVGAEGYMAPEQFDGIVSEKSDQYALACIAYELFTGRLPFKGSRSLLASQHRPKPIRSPHLLNSSLSIQAGQAILRALSFSPDQRYDNISAFITGLGTT